MSETTSVREISHRVRIDLPDNTPRITTPLSRRRPPAGLLLEYGIRRDVQRVDITIYWRNGQGEHFPPDREMPDWLCHLVEQHRPADVNGPWDDRRTGMGGWPLPAPVVDEGDVPGFHDPAALHAMVVRGLRAAGFSPEDTARYATAHQQDMLDRAGEVIDDEAWPHEKPEDENQELYRLADKVRRLLTKE